jgi:hypothetical protein
MNYGRSGLPNYAPMMNQSKREIERTLEDLEENPANEYPTVSLAELLAYEWETVDEERNLERRQDTGEVYHMPELDLEE